MKKITDKNGEFFYEYKGIEVRLVLTGQREDEFYMGWMGDIKIFGRSDSITTLKQAKQFIDKLDTKERA